MGFGSVAANMIMFIAVITIAASFVIFINAFAQETSTSLKVQKDRLAAEIKTDISITSISFTNTSSPDTTTVYVKNTGKTKLSLTYTDIYIDGIRFEQSDRDVTVENDTAVGNSLIWDPTEIIKIEARLDLTNTIHKVRIVTGNGIAAEDTFSN